jgi:hypothetical protein
LRRRKKDLDFYQKSAILFKTQGSSKAKSDLSGLAVNTAQARLTFIARLAAIKAAGLFLYMKGIKSPFNLID